MWYLPLRLSQSKMVPSIFLYNCYSYINFILGIYIANEVSGLQTKGRFNPHMSITCRSIGARTNLHGDISKYENRHRPGHAGTACP